MSDPDSETRQPTLRDAFLEDHRHLTRGFSQMLDSVCRGDVDGAATLADEIDRRAGSHIEFEERFLYPEVARVRGKEYADRLYDEHRTGLDALRLLLEHRAGERLDEDQCEELRERLQTMLDHAVSCGTLLSQLKGFDEERERALVAKLLELREKGTRWTGLREGK